jgi:3-hydroxyisobutyrate dehydrogenase-like beta-hydroxyacid dehydrogenase
MRIAFIGLGVMGRAMAGHLQTAGHDVIGFDRDPNAGKDAPHAPSIEDAVSNAEVIVTMLPDGQIVRQVVEAALGSLTPGALWIDTSSAEPWQTEQTAALLSKRQVAMIDAPVSGAKWGAEAATLVFMCGGGVAEIERARPLLDVMGREVFHVGPLGAGHAMKTINNVITAMIIVGTAEGMAIGKAYGLSPAAMVDVLNTSTGQSWWSTERLHQDVLSGAFTDGFRLSLMRKDVEIAHQLGASQGLHTPLMDSALSIWRAADQARGPGSVVTEMVPYVEDVASRGQGENSSQ